MTGGRIVTLHEGIGEARAVSGVLSVSPDFESGAQRFQAWRERTNAAIRGLPHQRDFEAASLPRKIGKSVMGLSRYPLVAALEIGRDLSLRRLARICQNEMNLSVSKGPRHDDQNLLPPLRGMYYLTPPDLADREIRLDNIAGQIVDSVSA